MKYDNRELLHTIFFLKAFKMLQPIRNSFQFIMKLIKPHSHVAFHICHITLHMLKLVHHHLVCNDGYRFMNRFRRDWGRRRRWLRGTRLWYHASSIYEYFMVIILKYSHLTTSSHINQIFILIHLYLDFSMKINIAKF